MLSNIGFISKTMFMKVSMYMHNWIRCSNTKCACATHGSLSWRSALNIMICMYFLCINKLCSNLKKVHRRNILKWQFVNYGVGYEYT